jgi:hypothetical protein
MGKKGRQIDSEVIRKKLPEYGCWRAMRARCNCPSSHIGNYEKYNIGVCLEWNDFDQFLKDMGRRPSNKYSIDRIDPKIGYSKENCRWATQKTQCSNRGNFNKTFIYKGESRILKEWSNIFKIKYTTLYQRIYRSKLSFEEAVLMPLDNKKFLFDNEYFGLRDLSEKFNIPYKTLVCRISGHKWGLERALTEKVRGKNV